MKINKRDAALRQRYELLSPEQREQVNQIVRRHVEACATMKVEPEIDVTLREAIDLVNTGNWEPDRPWGEPELRRQYQVYVTPIKEAA
ncbi:MAG: hypothetical protein ACKV2V_05410 [Blastocatellia bacterium]